MVSRKMLLEDVDDLSVFFGVPDILPKPKIGNVNGDATEETEPQDEDETSALAQRQRFADREDRYERLKKARSMGGKAVEDGYESSVFLDAYIESDFQDALGRLKDRAGKLMSDVHAKEYKDPSKGCLFKCVVVIIVFTD